ncbi:hypothetical protein [Pseudomonas aeruginosa]|uniref:hypothetical protein n=1 Tax=Pseudomonas aeruginosa TaxID=287 RepID=UPI001CBCC78E|nr:hypothetical protein [Pseudomonas aeruginosa]
MNIDWSKAPKGATHWEPNGPRIFESWMKNEGDSWFWWDEVEGKWRPSIPISEQRLGTFEARSQETWNGQGLPPLGVRVTIFDDGDLVYGHGELGEVIAHVEDCAVIRMSYGLGCFTAKNMRTNEQIAAEQRRKDIIELANVIRDAGDGNDYVLAEALYNSGYRKKESDDD